jgi:O-antigen/teichoic acid export membrane protein
VGDLSSVFFRLGAVGGKFIAMLVLADVGGSKEVGEFALFFGAVRQFGLDIVLYILTFIVACGFHYFGFASELPVPLFIFVAILIADHAAQELSRLCLVFQRANASNAVYALKTGLWGWFGAAAIYFGAARPEAETFYRLWLLADILAILLGLAAAFSMFSGARPSMPRPWAAWVKGGLHVSKWFYITSVSSMAISYADRFIIARQVSISQVGLYSFWQSIVSLLPVVVYAAVGMQALPQLVEAAKRGRNSQLHALHSAFSKKTFRISVVTGSIILGISPYMAALIGRPEFQATPLLVIFLVGGAIMNAYWQVPYQILYSKHEDRLLAVALTTLAIITTSSNIICVPFFGIVGAAGVSFFANGAIFLWLRRAAARLMWEAQDGQNGV